MTGKNLLLDTCVIIFLANDNQSAVSASAKKELINPNNALWISSASTWEIAIKTQVGKLKLFGNLFQFMDYTARLGAKHLPITSEHALATTRLAHHHKDPFDRLLIAQALIENFEILTPDKQFKRYSAKVVW